MIDKKGRELYRKMMAVICYDDDGISEEAKDAMKAFDAHLNDLNRTRGMLYSKNGEVLMEW